jgi:protein TonB
MKGLLPVLIGLVSPAAAEPPGLANTPSPPPPPIAVTNSPPPIVAVPSFPGAPVYVAPFPRTPPPPPAPRIVRPPQPRSTAQDLVTPADYPPAALAMNAEGRVGFVVTVGANGRVADCLITRSSRYAVLDSATCRLMRSRGRFTPAMDSNGNPAEATVQQEVEWRLP